MIKAFNYYKDGEAEIKQTPNQLAKNIVIDVLDRVNYWEEFDITNSDLMTEKEKEAVNDAVSKQLERVYKLLNY